jgi:hypothetical protein
MPATAMAPTLHPSTFPLLTCAPLYFHPHRRLVNMGVPQLRTLFQEVFGEATASNNAAWLRRKLSESPDSTYGQGRCATVRAR